MYHPSRSTLKIPRSANTVYLCFFVWIPEQRLFPYTALTPYRNRDGVFTAWYEFKQCNKCVCVCVCVERTN